MEPWLKKQNKNQTELFKLKTTDADSFKLQLPKYDKINFLDML